MERIITSPAVGRDKYLVAIAVLAIGYCFCSNLLVAQSDLSFPQVIVGKQFETVVQIANQVAVEVPVTIEVFSADEAENGLPLEVAFDGGTPASRKTVSLAPFQEITLRLGLPDAELKVGWLRIQASLPGGKLAASLFYRITSLGQVLDSVGVTDSRRYRFAQIQFDDRDETSETGIAFVNPDDTEVVCTVDLFQGVAHRGTFAVALGPREHFARLISEMFPESRRLQGSLIVESSAGRAIPILTLRVDGQQLTSLPVRPLGFTLQYEVRADSGELEESGYWVLDSEGLNVVGWGWTDSTLSQPGLPASGLEETALSSTGSVGFEGSFPVVGIWVGTSFQCFRREAFADGSVGAVFFNGTSVGEERTAGEPIAGKVTVLGADGQVRSTRHFIAFSKF